jgi:hypothetical protein
VSHDSRWHASTMHPLSLACHPQKAYLCVCSASTALSLAIVRSLATHKDKPHVSAISHMPSIIPYATFLHLTNKGIPYASALSRMPSGVSRQLKAYPMRPFCIHSLSHAVRCLATAEGIQLKINSLHPWACMCSKEQCNGFATRLRLMLAPCL